jgi:Lar family restriction alleviation protein
MSEILKPCPFCGLTDKLTTDTLGDPDDWFVECDRCRLGTHAVFQGREKAIAAWNTRSDPQREAMRSALEAIRDQGLDARQCMELARAALGVK